MIMTDEQIKRNALAYATENYGEYDEHDYTDHSGSNMCHAVSEEAFIAGAKWVYEHLKSPWINVKERLPEEDIDNISIPVVAITNIGYWFKGQYDYINKDWFFSEDPDQLDFEIDEFVTHWMHIPELKKGE